MKNSQLEKSVERLQVDIEDSVNSIIDEYTEYIKLLEDAIDKLKDEFIKGRFEWKVEYE